MRTEYTANVGIRWEAVVSHSWVCIALRNTFDVSKSFPLSVPCRSLLGCLRSSMKTLRKTKVSKFRRHSNNTLNFRRFKSYMPTFNLHIALLDAVQCAVSPVAANGVCGCLDPPARLTCAPAIGSPGVQVRTCYWTRCFRHAHSYRSAGETSPHWSFAVLSGEFGPIAAMKGVSLALTRGKRTLFNSFYVRNYACLYYVGVY